MAIRNEIIAASRAAFFVARLAQVEVGQLWIELLHLIELF
jgi:hypothetical protein